jgi:hypothetical protein
MAIFIATERTASAECLMGKLGTLAETAAKALRDGRVAESGKDPVVATMRDDLRSGAITQLMGSIRMGREGRQTVTASIKALIYAIEGDPTAPEAILAAYDAAAKAIEVAITSGAEETPFDFLRSVGLSN